MKLVLACIAGVGIGSMAHAATITLRADIGNLTGHTEALSYFGLSAGDSLTAYVTFDDDHSVPTFTNTTPSYSISYTLDYSLQIALDTPYGRIERSGSPARATSVDINSGSIVANENIEFIEGSPYASETGGFSLQNSSSDWSHWDRTDAITAAILNGFENNLYYHSIVLGDRSYFMRSNEFVYSIISEVPTSPGAFERPSEVPLPASAIFLLVSLGGLTCLRRRAAAA